MSLSKRRMSKFFGMWALNEELDDIEEEEEEEIEDREMRQDEEQQHQQREKKQWSKEWLLQRDLGYVNCTTCRTTRSYWFLKRLYQSETQSAKTDLTVTPLKPLQNQIRILMQ
jgi:FtsZ-interacting cell division protein YlmF